MSEHRAAVATARGKPLVVQTRKTPAPGPDEVIVKVKSIALNPVDYIQRDMGFPSVKFPAVLGSDIAGTIVEVGSAVAESIKVGARVCAFAPSFYHKGDQDWGAFQEKVRVPAATVTLLPDALSFNEAAILPMAVWTSFNGYYDMGLVPPTGLPGNAPLHKPEDKKGLLVWGAGGSVGSLAVQIGKAMGFSVYATASAKHHEYLKTLGATAVFDYKDAAVVANVVKAAKEDGVAMDSAYVATGSFSNALKVLKGVNPKGHLNMVEAPFSFNRLPWIFFSNYRNTTAKFVMPPTDPKEQAALQHFAFNVFLKEKLASGEVVPSPKFRVVAKGLESLQEGLNEHKKGVSGEKLVVEL